MRVALVGAELEENLGLRYMMSALEQHGHQAEIVPFNTAHDIPHAVKHVLAFDPQLTGLSMVFTGRAREFCRLAQTLRDGGYREHLIAGGHFASFNAERLLQEFPAFTSIGLGEGEDLICALADHLDGIEHIPGICYRTAGGAVATNPSQGNPENLDTLPFPKRTTFHDYFGKPIASVLTSRGCWRNCAFCSINAWYRRGGGKKFRVRSVENIVAELKELYFRYGIRIFNFQDDNFFLPNPEKALRRFAAVRDGLVREGVEGIAIAVKARPDSITYESIKVLDELGLFRVFLGVENASERGLRNLNRKTTFGQILNSLRILNDFDVHIAFNLLMFEPDTVMEDILINLRFLERHIENPLNFCRAEAYAGTGLEATLRPEGRLLGDYFGFDYRLKDSRSEVFHQIANYTFFDRNFSDFGLHYFNMQVDFTFQLLRRFYPQVLTQRLRGAVRNFIKQTNLDTYECLCEIYDFVAACDPGDPIAIRAFAREAREWVDKRSEKLHVQGEAILGWLDRAYERRGQCAEASRPRPIGTGLPFLDSHPIPYRGVESLGESECAAAAAGRKDSPDMLGSVSAPIPYDLFRSCLAEQQQAGR
jgi:radical SAM family protein/B12 binding protein